VNSPIENVKRQSAGRQINEPSGRFPLSVIILTYNEAANIPLCLATVEWADDVIVVDSESTDGTVQIARDVRPDVRAFVHPFRDFGEQRNWALQETAPKHDWVLFLDADERCNSECSAAIREAVKTGGPNVGFYLTYRNFFLGHWIKRCTLYPSWQLRLLKLGEVRFQKEGHGQRELTEGPLGYIHEPYDHYGFSKGIAHWIERHNRYSSDEMELLWRLRHEPLRPLELVRGGPIARRRCVKRIGARVWCRPLVRFLYTYILRRGFLDGHAGLIYCLLRVAHDIHVDTKLAEARFSKTVHPSHGGELTKGRHREIPV
jgi:glycosyltransferase involved in cell wall biosynthesis